MYFLGEHKEAPNFNTQSSSDQAIAYSELVYLCFLRIASHRIPIVSHRNRIPIVSHRNRIPKGSQRGAKGLPKGIQKEQRDATGGQSLRKGIQRKPKVTQRAPQGGADIPKGKPKRAKGHPERAKGEATAAKEAQEPQKEPMRDHC